MLGVRDTPSTSGRPDIKFSLVNFHGGIYKIFRQEIVVVENEVLSQPIGVGLANDATNGCRRTKMMDMCAKTKFEREWSKNWNVISVAVLHVHYPKP